jgi:hypothetical protein
MDSFNAYYRNVHKVSHVVRQHLPAIEWLVSTRDEDRGTGRTTALALAFLRDSFSSPTPTRVFDHHGTTGYDAFRSPIQWVKNRIQGMSPGVYIAEDGTMENQPAYAASPSSLQFNDTLAKVRQDFLDVVKSGIRMGVDPTWMMKQLRTALAESVMNT